MSLSVLLLTLSGSSIVWGIFHSCIWWYTALEYLGHQHESVMASSLLRRLGLLITKLNFHLPCGTYFQLVSFLLLRNTDSRRNDPEAHPALHSEVHCCLNFNIFMKIFITKKFLVDFWKSPSILLSSDMALKVSLWGHSWAGSSNENIAFFCLFFSKQRGEGS